VLQEAELEVDEEEEEAPVLASRLRRHPAPASTGPIDPARLRRRPVETRTMSSVPLDTMSSTRTKTCPRCKKQVPARVPRCLACGRLFS